MKPESEAVVLPYLLQLKAAVFHYVCLNPCRDRPVCLQAGIQVGARPATVSESNPKLLLTRYNGGKFSVFLPLLRRNFHQGDAHRFFVPASSPNPISFPFRVLSPAECTDLLVWLLLSEWSASALLRVESLEPPAPRRHSAETLQ